MPKSVLTLMRLVPLVFALLFADASVAQSPPPAAAAPVPPGQARVWFYRIFFPDDSGSMPAVAMNGQTIGYARAGSRFYRDVAAGPYHVTVASFGQDFNQAKDLVFAAGTENYIAIQSDPTWISNLGGFRRPTYYVWIEPPQIAAIHLSQTSLASGY
jgi:hypothetical protein